MTARTSTTQPASIRLAAFMRGWSMEAAHPRAAEIDALKVAAPAGTDIFLPAIPGQPRDQVVDAAARLKAVGLEPVPHLAARQFEGTEDLATFLRTLATAGATRALVIAGDRDNAAGPFPDALAVITSGLLQAHGIRSIRIGGYPEGHPRIVEAALARALTDKLAAAHDAGLEVQIVSQFCFDADAILGWLARLRGAGIAVPVRIGLAGPASLAALMRYAARCGVKASARGLVRNAAAMRGLLGHAAPDDLLRALAARSEGLGPVAPHFYSFGGVARTATYAGAASAGDLAD